MPSVEEEAESGRAQGEPYSVGRFIEGTWLPDRYADVGARCRTGRVDRFTPRGRFECGMESVRTVGRWLGGGACR